MVCKPGCRIPEGLHRLQNEKDRKPLVMTVPDLNRGGAGLTVGSEEGRREEAFVRQTGEGKHANHVVGVKAEAAERLAVQLLWQKEQQRRSPQLAQHPD